MALPAHDPLTPAQLSNPPIGWANGFKSPYPTKPAAVLPVGDWTIYAWPVGLVCVGAAKTTSQRYLGPLVALFAFPALVTVIVSAVKLIGSF
jgi:hypothetical protein